MDKWDRRFIDMAKLVATWSKDPSMGVGAVIVDTKNRVVSVGFNGYPRGVPDDDSLLVREEKYKKVVHSEVNALLFANTRVDACTIYVYPIPPCSNCMSAIIQSGIARVVTVIPTEDIASRWGDSNRIALEMAAHAGVIVNYVMDKDEQI